MFYYLKRRRECQWKCAWITLVLGWIRRHDDTFGVSGERKTDKFIQGV